jgi:peroxiredoxin
MSLRPLALALLLVIPGSAAAADLPLRPDAPRNTAVASILALVAAEPAATHLLVGDHTPSFSYLGTDGRWHDFADLSGGPLLMLFGASDSSLRAIVELTPALGEIGVTPVAVLAMRTGSAERLSRKLDWSFPVITDPKRAIARLFNSLDSKSLGSAPSFFVIDERRTIRALAHGPLPSAAQLVTRSAQSLGLAVPTSALLSR